MPMGEEYCFTKMFSYEQRKTSQLKFVSIVSFPCFERVTKEQRKQGYLLV